MNDLSHGLAPLAVSGNRIVCDGAPILLRGVNRSGLEYTEPDAAGFLSAAEFTADEVREIVLNWRANVLRVPFTQDWALRGRAGHTAETYRSALDQVIDWAAALGAYTILDLQWLDAGLNRQTSLPDDDSVELWRELAQRYRDEPAVLFDLFNEPHDIGAPEWNGSAARLIAEVRREHPASLILIGGVDWAFDLSDVVVEAPNLVYSAHIYSNRKPRHWTKGLGRADEVPVFVGEWGGDDGDLDFGRRLANEMRTRGLGWTAWSWVDNPKLIRPPRAPAYEPTPFGELVRSELLVTPP
jgi:endoglucanase